MSIKLGDDFFHILAEQGSKGKEIPFASVVDVTISAAGCERLISQLTLVKSKWMDRKEAEARKGRKLLKKAIKNVQRPIPGTGGLSVQDLNNEQRDALGLPHHLFDHGPELSEEQRAQNFREALFSDVQAEGGVHVGEKFGLNVPTVQEYGDQQRMKGFVQRLKETAADSERLLEPDPDPITPI